MRAEPHPIRLPLGAAASTLVALVAMSATMAGSARCPAGDLTQSTVVRAVAAAVAAAARHLVDSERCAVTAALDRSGRDHEASRPGAAAPDLRLPARILLAERLLDLPPPAC